MMYSISELNSLRESIKQYMGTHRYEHTLGVENAAIFLGSIFIPELVTELRAAALLHDVTKEMSYEDQFSLLNAYGIALSDEDKSALPALHSFSAAPFVKERFANYATEHILSAVFNHTLGAENITLFDKIIFIADFIEDGRTYDSCIATARFIRENITKENTQEQNLYFLDQAILMAIDATVSSVERKKQVPHSRTIAMRNKLQMK